MTNETAKSYANDMIRIIDSNYNMPSICVPTDMMRLLCEYVLCDQKGHLNKSDKIVLNIVEMKERTTVKIISNKTGYRTRSGVMKCLNRLADKGYVTMQKKKDGNHVVSLVKNGPQLLSEAAN